MDYSFYVLKIAQMPEDLRLRGVEIAVKAPKGLNTPSFRYHDGFSSLHSSRSEDQLKMFGQECADLIAEWIDPQKLIEFDLNTLDPGAALEEHTDMTGGRNAGWSVPSIHKVHFVLQAENGVTYHRRSTQIKEPTKTPMLQGGVYVYNNYVPHWVENNGSIDRIHFVLIYSDPKWEEKYKMYDKLGLSPLQMF